MLMAMKGQQGHRGLLDADPRQFRCDEQCVADRWTADADGQVAHHDHSEVEWIHSHGLDHRQENRRGQKQRRRQGHWATQDQEEDVHQDQDGDLTPARETIHWEKIVEKFSTVSSQARASPAPMMSIMTAVISPVFRSISGSIGQSRSP